MNIDPFPTVGVKWKDKGKEPVRGVCKKMKAHKVPPVYNLTNDDMDWIDYQVRYVVEEVIEEAMRKQIGKHQKVQNQLVSLQLLEVPWITLEHRSKGGPSTILMEEVEDAHPVLTELTTGCRMWQIDIDIVEFPTLELQE
jgi:hypothetical protein